MATVATPGARHSSSWTAPMARRRIWHAPTASRSVGAPARRACRLSRLDTTCRLFLTRWWISRSSASRSASARSKLAFALVQFAHVDGDHDPSDRCAVGAHDLRHPLPGAEAPAVFRDIVRDQFEGAVADEPCHVRHAGLVLVGGHDDVEHRAPHDLVGRPAERLLGVAVPVADAQVVVERDDDAGDLVEQRGLECELVVQALAVGDIAHVALDSRERVAIGVLDRAGIGFCHHRGAIGPAHLDDARLDAVRVHRRDVAVAVRVRRVEAACIPPLEGGGDAESGHAGDGGVGVEELPVGRTADEADVDGFEQRRHARGVVGGVAVPGRQHLEQRVAEAVVGHRLAQVATGAGAEARDGESFVAAIGEHYDRE